MVPVPSCPLTWDYWTGTPSEYVDLTCLMPNSMYIPLKALWDATLQDVKEELWHKAEKYPLLGMLHDKSGYIFRFVNSLAVQEDIDDESKRLRDIRPVCGVLIVVKPIKGEYEKDLNVRISHLIGKDLNEFENLRSSEVNDFRLQMRMLAEESLLDLSKSTPLQLLQYKSPSRLADNYGSPQYVVPATLLSHLNNQCFILSTKIANSDFSFSLNVPMNQTPQQTIVAILKKAETSLNIRTDLPSKYVLKVCGREEYLVPPDKPLIQFLYIQETLAIDDVPQVMTVHLDTLQLTREIPEHMKQSSELAKNTNTLRKRHNVTVYSWDVDQYYSCLVQRVGGLNVEPGQSVEVVCLAGIFHGGKSLCEPQKTKVTTVSKEGVAQWDEDLTFPIKVYNLPRMARLCFAIYEINKIKGKKKGKDNKDYVNKLAWANTMIFDYKQQLRVGGVTLFMWAHAGDETQGDDLLLHPLGTVVPNPNTDSCAAFELRFSNYGCHYPIQFPKEETVRAYGERIENGRSEAGARLQADFQRLGAAAEKDLDIHEQDRKDIWAAREYFRVEASGLLAKVLSCVEWGERSEAASAARMLCAWPALEPEAALELLDYAYADGAVRSFAVKCLDNISDEELLLYLLQLVQALKHESYLMCDLAKFLLQRAFKNMTIGHYLFWHLRSEMHGPAVPSVTVRFGLMLEAYCRGCQDHINSLIRQVACLEKLKWVSQEVAKKKEISKARATLEKHLQEDHCIEAISNFISPLNPSFVCKKIKSGRVMDSKKRPLLLDFENNDSTGKDIRIILKIGDDLRQDMFTLQMLRIMDRLWKSHGYDFRLSPYNCISMEHGVGMIEVVEDAETVANIQKQNTVFNAASPMSKTNILQWLKRHNDTEQSLKKSIDEFTMSCAGYCVATYVLGIADRHPDNIMVKKNGQLFHIDFGHFLGKFKHKYGIKRERVPFVLTHDFIHVINKGQRGTGVNEPIDFKRFKEYCEEAFKIIRKHGHLILSLFSMMISTGLPELSSEKDLQYLRETLVMDLSEERALEHFRLKFIEAVKNRLTVTVNWAIHNIDRNN